MTMIEDMPADMPADSPLWPSINTYGSENISISKEIALNKLFVEIDGIEPIKTPLNYYPARSIPKGSPHPTFNPTDTIFFRKSGRVIPEEILSHV